MYLLLQKSLITVTTVAGLCIYRVQLEDRISCLISSICRSGKQLSEILTRPKSVCKRTTQSAPSTPARVLLEVIVDIAVMQKTLFLDADFAIKQWAE